MPINEDKLSTAGSFKIWLASACCRSLIAAKEISSGASVTTCMTPLSCTGKKPLGITQYNAPAKTTVPSITASVKA